MIAVLWLRYYYVFLYIYFPNDVICSVALAYETLLACLFHYVHVHKIYSRQEFQLFPKCCCSQIVIRTKFALKSLLIDLYYFVLRRLICWIRYSKSSLMVISDVLRKNPVSQLKSILWERMQPLKQISTFYNGNYAIRMQMYAETAKEYYC